MRRDAAGLVAALIVWTGAQIAWLRADERIPEGDVLSNVGALELFHEEAERSGLVTVLRRAWLEDFGEYPTLATALQGWASEVAGVADLGGDGPAIVGLVWIWLLVLATASIARRVHPAASMTAGLLLLASPWLAGLGRSVLLEPAMSALVACSAAVGVAAASASNNKDRVWVLWASCGLFAGFALLAKQTAILALAPLVLVAARQWRGLLVAGSVAAAIAGPWYVRRIGAEGEYVLRSAEANPDAVGLLHQLAIHPLALAQLPWGLWGIAAVGVGGLIARRKPSNGALLAVLALGLLPLLLLPKKYPRLLLPLLPLIAIWAAAWMAEWPAKVRVGVLAVLIAAQGAALVGWLTPTMWGLTGLDERCAQRWVRPPHPEGIDWPGIVGAVAANGGGLESTRVGAVDWPVPPCEHQTTLDLGEHLRIEARRRGQEAFVLAGESWNQSGGRWSGGVPDLILSDGPLTHCEGCGVLELVGAWPLIHPDWSADLRLYRRAR